MLTSAWGGSRLQQGINDYTVVWRGITDVIFYEKVKIKNWRISVSEHKSNAHIHIQMKQPDFKTNDERNDVWPAHLNSYYRVKSLQVPCQSWAMGIGVRIIPALNPILYQFNGKLRKS